MTDKYLTSFVGEMRGYCNTITEKSKALRNLEPATQESGAAIGELARLFHTITGLTSSLEIADLADLAEGLESCLLSSAATPPAPAVNSALTDLLDFTAAYFSYRLQVMETKGQFLPAAKEDAEPLQLLEERLWELGNQLEPPDEDALLQAEPLSAEDLAILHAFNDSDLAAADTATFHEPTAPPAEHTPAIASSAQNLSSAEADIPPEMVELFRTETRDDVILLQGALTRLEASEERPAAVQEMRHVAHKIKGAASTLNLQVIAGLAHCLEDILDLLKNQRLEYAPSVVDTLMYGFLELEAILNSTAPLEEARPEALERLRGLYTGLLADSSLESASDPAATQPDPRRLAAAMRQPDAAFESSTSDISNSLMDAQRESNATLPGRELSLRVEVSRLDQLMRLVSELASNRSSAEQVRQEVNESLTEVRHAVQKMTQLVNELDEEIPLHLPDSSLPVNDQETAKRAALNLERFEDVRSHLLWALRESVNDISTMSDSLHQLLIQMNGLAEAQDHLTIDIQHDITQLRLVPIGQIFPRLQLTARMIAQEQNKHINFVPSGATTEIDREIIEAITGPLIQLVTNCVVHGIESAEERRARSKPEVGTITLRAYYTGNEISIEVSDDGCGFKQGQLIHAAVALGKISQEEAEHLEPEEALNLALLPDISTSPEVTTIAGRGVGLDMVRTVVENLKGTLHIHSTPGEGTTFHIRLPISLGILHALFVRAGQQTYAVSMSSVERIWQPDDPQTLNNTLCFSLSEVLHVANQQNGEAAAEPKTTAPQAALVVPLRQRHIGVYVDEVLTDHEVVIKRLPPHLRRRGVRGAIVNPTGELLLLLDLPELAHRALSGSMTHRFVGAPVRPAPAVPSTTGPKVLVVDDSLFIRRTLELQLTRAGYRVKTVKDGAEALESIQKDRPHLVLLDIEMPQLDGYELLSTLRSQPGFSDLPVAMLTSRAADEHRQYAMDLGANAYLVKPCPHDVLLETVAELTGRPLANKS